MLSPSFELLFAVEENTKGQVEHKYDSDRLYCEDQVLWLIRAGVLQY